MKGTFKCDLVFQWQLYEYRLFRVREKETDLASLPLDKIDTRNSQLRLIKTKTRFLSVLKVYFSDDQPH